MGRITVFIRVLFLMCWLFSVGLRRPFLCCSVPCSVSQEAAFTLGLPAALGQQELGWWETSVFILALHPHPHLPFDPKVLEHPQTSVSLSVQWGR